MFNLMKSDTNDPGILTVFMIFFTSILGILSFVPYFLVKLSNEVVSDFRNTWFCEKYDELKKKYGPILKETSVAWFFGRSTFKVTLSICRDVLLISSEGHSFCVPYTQYIIRKETNSWHSADWLIIEDVIPASIASKTYLQRSMTLSHRSLHPEEFDLVMSLVEQAKQKQQNPPN